MEQQKDFKQCKSMLHILRFLYSKVFLNFIDVVSVAICFWTIFGLIYITFLKDSAEIFIYATMKYACRLRWLYRTLKMDKSMKLKEDIAPTVALSNNSSAAICDTVNTAFDHSQDSFSSHANNNEQLRKFSPVTENHLLQCSPSASVTLVLPTSSSSAFVKQVLSISSSSGSMKQLLPKSSPAASTKELHSKSSPSANTKQLLLTSYSTFSPVSSISNQIIRTPRTLDFRHSIDETNFENIDLHSDQDSEPDAVILSMDNNLRVKPNLSVRWKFGRIEILDSFRTKCNNFRSTSCAKMKCQNLATKIGEVLPTQMEDKETLIVQTDSPGCCGTFFQFLKSKFQVDPIPSCSMPYKRF